MELKIEQVAIPEKIAFNYEELKQELSDKVKMYETLVYTDDQIKSAKADRADLNRLKKALNDERIRREKEYMHPFNAFKTQINEIIGIIDKPVALIDKQIKEYEEQQRQEKKGKIAEYFSSCSYPEWLTLPMIWDDKWLNASASMKSIQETIDIKISTIKSDLATLSDLPEFAFEAIETYKTTLDLNKSIAEGHRLSEMQKQKAEQERIKAEQERLRQEQEKARQEELAKADETKRREEFVSPAAIDLFMDGESSNRSIQTAENLPEPVKQWVAFSALLSVEDARELAGFFRSRNIEFKKINFKGDVK